MLFARSTGVGRAFPGKVDSSTAWRPIGFASCGNNNEANSFKPPLLRFGGLSLFGHLSHPFLDHIHPLAYLWRTAHGLLHAS